MGAGQSRVIGVRPNTDVAIFQKPVIIGLDFDISKGSFIRRKPNA
jgi:hypothetical protein